MLLARVGDVFCLALTECAAAGPLAKHAVLASTRQVNLSSKRFSVLVDSRRINCYAGRADLASWLEVHITDLMYRCGVVAHEFGRNLPSCSQSRLHGPQESNGSSQGLGVRAP